jgi:multidrug resistance efflux pump
MCIRDSVQRVLVAEGERVTLGQDLVQLEPFDLLQREQQALKTFTSLDAAFRRLASGLRSEEIAQAKARYDQFKARLDLLEAGPRDQEINAAGGRLRVAEAELTLAKRNYERTAQLFQRNAVPREEIDAASEQLEAAEAMVIVRKEELELLKSGTRVEEKREARARVEEAHQAWQLATRGYQEQEIEEAKAARDAAEAALEVVREQKKELTITSPVDGVVEALDLQKGDLAPAGAPVLSVMDDRHMWVRAYVPQNRVGLRIGQQLWVTVDSFADERFAGEVTFIARQAEFTPSNVQTPEERSKQVFRVKVQLKEGLKKLRPGMTADVWLDSEGEPR